MPEWATREEERVLNGDRVGRSHLALSVTSWRRRSIAFMVELRVSACVPSMSRETVGCDTPILSAISF